MPDFDLSKLPDLLARLGEPLDLSFDDWDVARIDSVRADEISATLSDAPAAVLALMAERDSLRRQLSDCKVAVQELGAGREKVVVAEREACAQRCRDIAEAQAATEDEDGERNTYFVSGARACEDAIRARGDA